MRWNVNKKLEVLLYIKTGTMSKESACKKYDLSIEELDSWQRMYSLHGKNGLRTTRTRCYRIKANGV